MHNWVAILAWGAALLFAVVVLGFGLYEITWKMRRLRRDAARLQDLTEAMTRLQGELATARQRVDDAARQRVADAGKL